jgi:hypothetical protein
MRVGNVFSWLRIPPKERFILEIGNEISDSKKQGIS